ALPPESDIKCDIVGCPLWANRRHHSINSSGAGEHRLRLGLQAHQDRRTPDKPPDAGASVACSAFAGHAGYRRARSWPDRPGQCSQCDQWFSTSIKSGPAYARALVVNLSSRLRQFHAALADLHPAEIDREKAELKVRLKTKKAKP